MQHITPHDLRHTCASLAVSAGVNVLVLQRMPGHTSAKVTLDTYADLFDADLDVVAVTLHRWYSPESVGKMWARAAKSDSSAAGTSPGGGGPSSSLTSRGWVVTSRLGWVRSDEFGLR